MTKSLLARRTGRTPAADAVAVPSGAARSVAPGRLAICSEGRILATACNLFAVLVLLVTSTARAQSPAPAPYRSVHIDTIASPALRTQFENAFMAGPVAKALDGAPTVEEAVTRVRGAKRAQELFKTIDETVEHRETKPVTVRHDLTQDPPFDF